MTLIYSLIHTTYIIMGGSSYTLICRAEMEELIARDEFIENAEFSGNLYGTSKQAVNDVLHTGKICILDIDVQGRSQKSTLLRNQ